MQVFSNNQKCSTPSQMRRGTTLFELVTACILITTAISVAFPMLSSVKRERLATVKRQAAMVEAENILERISTMKLPALTNDSLAELKPSAWLKDRLGTPELVTTVIEVSDDASAKQIEVRINWKTTDLRTAHVKFQTWVYSKMIDSEKPGQS